ncbi:hypothetical protein [Streptomyces sp. MspMP-M5]|uniref:hypothetical protein n=1 Tax=unclassified Streptomyces TaxID=2593676 RepID=UPI0003663397|nr:hypothetical protein [Streptomyces sp. MspMP-M5]MYT33612.1 hypothetical protein [Streptomyces sp. SID8354]
MLAQLPLPYLLLMAAFATFIFCLAIEKWMKARKLTVVLLILSVGCCLGMMAVGHIQYQHWNARQMLVLYSFAWTGLTIGLLPAGKLFRKYGEEMRRGVKREKYEYPAWTVATPIISVSLMCILAFVLAT